MKMNILSIAVSGILTLMISPLVSNCQVKDIEGRSYKICTVRSKQYSTVYQFTAENLATATFANGDKILHAVTNEEWVNANLAKTPAWCYYNNDPLNGTTYGKLYNWYAVQDTRNIAPEGWQVADYNLWSIVQEILGKDSLVIRLKSTTGWEEDGSGTNESGFNVLPGGFRSSDGSFKSMNMFTYFWTDNRTKDGQSAGAIGIGYKMTNAFVVQDIPFNRGFYVRCVKRRW